MHDAAIHRHDQDSHQQKRREQAVDDGGPEERPDRIDVCEVDRDRHRHREEDDGVEGPSFLQFLVEPLPPDGRDPLDNYRAIRKELEKGI